MNAGRIVWVMLIVGGASIAWAILGQSVSRRTLEANQRLRAQVEGLWGTPLAQPSPRFWATWEVREGNKRTTRREEVRAEINQVRADLKLDLRRKGLLWYRCYRVSFTGDYVISNPQGRAVTAHAAMLLPTANAVYENFRFEFGGKQATPAGQDVKASLSLAAKGKARLKVHYETRGLETWQYSFGATAVAPVTEGPEAYPMPLPPGTGSGGVANVRNLDLVVATDFDRVNFPPRTISPTTNEELPGGGRKLTWRFGSLISGFAAGVEVPEKLDAGPVASRIAFFAPIGLLFFVAVLVIIGAMQGRNLHPMHHFFLAAAFFAFHLLFAYLADHLAVGVTFLIAAATSLVLVGAYVWRALGAGFTLKVILPSQLLFLILFSYAFFFQGYTGLTITIASIVTLFILMQVTAKVDWESKFAGGTAPRQMPPMPPAPPPILPVSTPASDDNGAAPQS